MKKDTKLESFYQSHIFYSIEGHSPHKSRFHTIDGWIWFDTEGHCHLRTRHYGSIKNYDCDSLEHAKSEFLKRFPFEFGDDGPTWELKKTRDGSTETTPEDVERQRAKHRAESIAFVQEFLGSNSMAESGKANHLGIYKPDGQ